LPHNCPNISSQPVPNLGSDYNPLTGRFETMDDPDFDDISDPLTLHKYVYTGDDPVDAVDPSGHKDTAETTTLDETTIEIRPETILLGLGIACVAKKVGTLLGVLAEGGTPYFDTCPTGICASSGRPILGRGPATSVPVLMDYLLWVVGLGNFES
jgi:hypothetical protein